MIMKVLKISFCVFFISYFACDANNIETPTETNQTTSPSPIPEVLKSGDRLWIIFHNDHKFALERIVDEEGVIDLIKIGNVKVAGKTISEAESIIQSACINKKFYKDLTVEIKVNPKWKRERLRSISTLDE